jgi:hypothetical protein
MTYQMSFTKKQIALLALATQHDLELRMKQLGEAKTSHSREIIKKWVEESSDLFLFVQNVFRPSVGLEPFPSGWTWREWLPDSYISLSGSPRDDG